MGINDFLKDYTPEKVTDSFGIIKGTFTCVVNYARIEEYSGDNEEWKGVKFFRYELEIAEGQEFEGRKFWKSVALNNEDRVKKLADILFTVGLEFKNEEELLACAEKFVEMTLEVKAWGFVTKEEKAKAKSAGTEPESTQTHIIKGIATTTATRKPSTVPF